jgi:predicted nucleic acid-binding Zn ribbon protein
MRHLMMPYHYIDLKLISTAYFLHRISYADREECPRCVHAMKKQYCRVFTEDAPGMRSALTSRAGYI